MLGTLVPKKRSCRRLTFDAKLLHLSLIPTFLSSRHLISKPVAIIHLLNKCLDTDIR